MKKQILFIALILLFIYNAFGQTIEVSQGLSYVAEDNRLITKGKYDYEIFMIEDLTVSYTDISVNLFDVLFAEVQVELGNNYNYVYANTSLVKQIENISPFVKCNFRHTDNYGFTDTYLDTYIGLQTTNKIGAFNINFSGYIGYVFLDEIDIYKNRVISIDKSNNIITGLEAAVELKLKKLSLKIYAGIESFQVFLSNSPVIIGGFMPSEIKNIFGFNAEYEFDSLTFFVELDYYCIHPEKPWNPIFLKETSNYYDGNKKDLKVGLRLSI